MYAHIIHCFKTWISSSVTNKWTSLKHLNRLFRESVILRAPDRWICIMASCLPIINPKGKKKCTEKSPGLGWHPTFQRCFEEDRWPTEKEECSETQNIRVLGISRSCNISKNLKLIQLYVTARRIWWNKKQYVIRTELVEKSRKQMNLWINDGINVWSRSHAWLPGDNCF